MLFFVPPERRGSAKAGSCKNCLWRGPSHFRPEVGYVTVYEPEAAYDGRNQGSET